MERQLKAVANRRRLEILTRLKADRTLTVSRIAKAIRMSVRATSQHLQILRAAAIVISQKRGLFVGYRISLEQEEVVRTLLRSL